MADHTPDPGRRLAQELDLDLTRVKARIAFLEAYANSTLAELAEQGGLREDRHTWPPGGALTTAVREMRDVLIADAASARREAGQWMLMVDSRQAESMLTAAGELYQELGLPFGTYLQVVAAPPAVVGDSRIDDFGAQLVDLAKSPPEGHSAGTGMSGQQQAYLMLAGAGHPVLRARYLTPLTSMATSRTALAASSRVGALGTPARAMADIAAHLLAQREESLLVISTHLVSMSQRYAETMAQARLNSYLWQNCAAPVDAVDIDTVGVTALTARTFGSTASREAITRAAQRVEMPTFAMTQLEVGLALATDA